MHAIHAEIPVAAAVWSAVLSGALLASPPPPPPGARGEDGDGGVSIAGELKTWHKVTLTLDGPFARELDGHPNPFTDYRLTVTFAHESGAPVYRVPGYFAADGNAAETSAESGTKWRAHLSPDSPGEWSYEVELVRGERIALEPERAGDPIAPYHGKRGSFRVAPTGKTGRDFRARGRLEYAGGHHLRFAGSGEYFLKAGADAPETLLAYADFDGTEARKKNAPLKTWAPHLDDWREGDPTWKGGKGRGLIGAVNYLAEKGVNAVSFLTYNAGGDGDNVWPFVARDAKLHYDCSKLDQWQVVFDHAQARGIYLHFKMQETEMDDDRHGDRGRGVPESLDGGRLGPERTLYCRELVARFAYALALNWNLGEENTQSPEEQRAMAAAIRRFDPYGHLIVVHTYPNQQDQVYSKLLGDQSELTGASLQNHWSAAHRRTLHWVEASRKAGKPWVVANDEQGPANLGVPPDPGYMGFDGFAAEGDHRYDLHAIRKATLWGTLMAGGAGVEYYFGYQLPENDLTCEDFRSRDRTWDYCRIALEFFRDHRIPFHEMRCEDGLAGNPAHDNRRYVLAKAGELYLVYLPEGGAVELDLSGQSGEFTLRWFDPRAGGTLQEGSLPAVSGGARRSLGEPPSAPGEDWLAVLKRSD